MRVVDDDQVVQALASNGPDQPLRDRIRLRGLERRQYGLDTQHCRFGDEVTSVAVISIAK